jgi:hypothetical protein
VFSAAFRGYRKPVMGLIAGPIQLGVTVVRGAVETGLSVVRAAAGLVTRDPESDRYEAVYPAPTPRAPEEAANGGAPPAPPVAAPAPAPVAEPAPPVAEPVEPAPPAPAPPPSEGHVSEEPVEVAAFAEPGAEDGPGPELDVEEPWDGYANQDAPTVVQLLSTVGRESAAAVELYESVHRQRRTVLEAAERRLTVLSSPASGENS